jgi:3-dehydroquinate synthase
MVAALRYGREVGLLTEADAERLVGLIRSVGKLPSVKNIPFDDIWEALMRDKKFQQGDIRMVLLNSLGKAAVYNGIEKESLRDFLQRFLKKS